MHVHNLILQRSSVLFLRNKHELELAEVERKSVEQTVSLRIELTVVRARQSGR
jgi:hypothetical protein